MLITKMALNYFQWLFSSLGQLVEILPSALVLFILRKLPPKRGITQYHPIHWSTRVKSMHVMIGGEGLRYVPPQREQRKQNRYMIVVDSGEKLIPICNGLHVATCMYVCMHVKELRNTWMKTKNMRNSETYRASFA